MVSFKNISMVELAKRGEGKGRGIVNTERKEKGEYVDPYTLGVPFASQVVAQDLVVSPWGTHQLKLSWVIINDDNTTKKAGNTYLNLPIVPSETEMTPDQEKAYLDRAAEDLEDFLKAVLPIQYLVAPGGIDKSDSAKWIYFDVEGNEMSYDVRQKRKTDIKNSVVQFAQDLFDDQKAPSLVDACCVIIKKANPKNPKKPYVNYYPFNS